MKIKSKGHSGWIRSASRGGHMLARGPLCHASLLMQWLPDQRQSFPSLSGRTFPDMLTYLWTRAQRSSSCPRTPARKKILECPIWYMLASTRKWASSFLQVCRSPPAEPALHKRVTRLVLHVATVSVSSCQHQAGTRRTDEVTRQLPPEPHCGSFGSIPSIIWESLI